MSLATLSQVSQLLAIPFLAYILVMGVLGRPSATAARVVNRWWRGTVAVAVAGVLAGLAGAASWLAWRPAWLSNAAKVPDDFVWWQLLGSCVTTLLLAVGVMLLAQRPVIGAFAGSAGVAVGYSFVWGAVVADGGGPSFWAAVFFLVFDAVLALLGLVATVFVVVKRKKRLASAAEPAATRYRTATEGGQNGL